MCIVARCLALGLLAALLGGCAYMGEATDPYNRCEQYEGDTVTEDILKYLILRKRMIASGERRQVMPVSYANCLARSDVKDAQYQLGLRYLLGVDVEQDDKRARSLMKIAARRIPNRTYIYVPGVGDASGTVMPVTTGAGQAGHQAAMLELATMYEQGRGGKKNVKKAAKLRARAQAAETPNLMKYQ